METLNYLNNGHGLESWLLTKDHKRIALLYLVVDHRVLLHRRLVRVLIRLELLTPAGDLMTSETYNKMFTMHGVVMVFFFLIPSIPGGARQLPGPDHDRREGPGVPAHQPAELVHLHPRRALHAGRGAQRRRRHRLDVLHAVQHARRRTAT